MRRAGAISGAGVLVAAALASASAPAQPAPAVDPEALRGSIRQLRRATESQRDGSHLLRLSALRQLRDPAMRPFFERLLRHTTWQVQVHATLALAETGPTGQLDPALVQQVDRRAQDAIITNAIDLDLLPVESMQQLLAEAELADMPRLLLTAELHLHGIAPDEATLRRLAGSADFRVAGLASCLLAQLGDAGVLSAFSDRLDNLAPAARRRHVAWLIEAARQYKLSAVASWVSRVLDDPDIDASLASAAIVTLLQLDLPRGFEQWTRRLGERPTLVEQVRAGLLLLESEARVPPAAWERLTMPDPLVKAMVATGTAIAAGRDPAPALIDLINLGHMRSAAWALQYARSLPDADAAMLYRHLVDHVEEHRHGRSEWVDMAVTATERLFQIDPAAVEQRLAAATDDGLQQQTILLGLIASPDPAAADAAAGVRRIGAGQADSLALLLIARHASRLEENDLRDLGVIVRGGGRLSLVLQVQAAWLYLRHTGMRDLALEEVFGSSARP